MLLFYNLVRFQFYLKFHLHTLITNLPIRYFLEKHFLDRRQRGPRRSVWLVIIGWFVDWLVGNAVFSETALRIFLIFYIKFGDYKGRKITELFDLEIFAKKVSKLDQNQKLSYFSQKRLERFFWFLA